MNRILAIIPAWNEATHVASVVHQTGEHLPVLVVDDGSSDETVPLARQAGATVVSHGTNKGKGAALCTGFRYALDNGYDAVVALDADGQHAPEEIPAFVEAYERDGADLVIGARDFRQMPIVRRTSNTIGTYMFSWALGQWVPDNQSGYRLASRRMMEITVDSRESSWEFEVEMILLCVLHGLKLSWVPIQTIYAGETSHIRPWRHIVNFFRITWHTRQRVRAHRRSTK